MAKSIGPFPAGADFNVDFTLVDELEAPIDLTGATVTAKVETLTPSAVSLSLVTPTGGVCRWAVTSTVSAKWKVGSHDGDVKAVLASGAVRYFGFDIRIWVPRGLAA